MKKETLITKIFSLFLTISIFAATTANCFGKRPGTDNNVVKISKEPIHSGHISPMIYGGFIELLDDLVPGMWAEMLNDRNFEGVEKALSWCYYVGEPNFCDREWDDSPTWEYDTNEPFNGVQSARLMAQGKENAVLSQSSLAVKKGMKYFFDGYFKADNPGLGLTVKLGYWSPEGNWTVLGEAKLSSPKDQWGKQQCEIVSSGTTDQAVFKLEVTGAGSLWVDKISLMPEDNQKGWRADVTKAVRDSRPSLIRWGGLIVDPGDYKWKEGVGERDLRVPFKNKPWGRIDPNDVGLDEFLQFCELVDAEPLVCVSFTDGPESARDLVNYCNAGADTEWGAKRAANGHTEPYGVKYWQVGNECRGEAYLRGLLAICKAIKETDEAAIVLSSYPSPEVLAESGKYLDYVCPHHYTPDLKAHADDFIAVAKSVKEASFDHEIKIGVTEWNITAGWFGWGRGKLQTLYTGLYTGQYLNVMQRHSDVVGLACRSNMTNSFGSGMIQTNAADICLSPSYYVMKLYGEHSLPVPLKLKGAPEGLDMTACASEDGQSVCVFVVNTGAEPVSLKLDMSDYGSGFCPVRGEVVCDTDDIDSRR